MDKIIALNCPGCNQPTSSDQKQCKFCKRPIVIQHTDIPSMTMPELAKYMQTYRSVSLANPEHKSINASLALCYMKMKLYDKALEVLNKIMNDNVDNPDIFFYVAVCCLKDKKPFLHQRSEIDMMIDNLGAANSIEMRPIHYLLLSYIRKDYFDRKFLKTSPSWEDELGMAIAMGATQSTANELSTFLGLALPEEIMSQLQ